MRVAHRPTSRPAPGSRDQVPRVLVVSHLFPSPENPGLGSFVHEQVRALRRHQGIDARVISFRPFWMDTTRPWILARVYLACLSRFDCLRWEQHEGVPVVYLPYLAGRLFGFWLHASSSWTAAWRALPWLRATFPFELVHAHTGYPSGSVAGALARRCRVPLVVTEHTNPFDSLMANWLVRRQTLGALDGAARIWCVSSALAAEVRSHLPEGPRQRVAVLANGVDTAAFAPPARWAPDPAAPRLLSVTALEPYKDPLLLLHAFRRLKERVPGARLVVVGAGPLEAEARAYVEAHGLSASVRLLGRQPRCEVARLLREECDLFVLSSASETFGVVLIEALASGKPVVATDCGGPRDVVTGPELGALCPPGDPRALADALLQVTRRLPSFDPQLLRRRAAERFAYDRLAASLAAEYSCLVPGRRAAA